MDSALTLEVIGLLVLLLAGSLAAVHVATTRGRVASFSVLAIVTYLVIYPLSGVAHLLVNESSSRGYFDLVSDAKGGGLGRFLVCALGLFALVLPVLVDRGAAKRAPALQFSEGMRRATLLIGFLILPVAALSAVQMLDYAATVDSARITALSGGMARVGFASQWITWAVSFIALGLLVRRDRVSANAQVVIVLGLSVAIIASALSWTGGRAIVLMMATPLVLAVWPSIRKGVRATLVVVAASAFASFLAVTTVARAAGYSGAGFSLARVLDWEVGRYSMIGYAVDRVETAGLEWGETLLEGVFQVPRGVIQLVGLQYPNGPRSITELSGADLLGDSRLTYIVPGMSAELYINFGVLGVVAGYFLLGALITKVDRELDHSGDPAFRLAVAYLGVLLIFCTFSSQSGAGFNYFFFTGFPVVVLMLFYAVRSRSRSRVTGPERGLVSRSRGTGL